MGRKMALAGVAISLALLLLAPAHLLVRPATAGSAPSAAVVAAVCLAMAVVGRLRRWPPELLLLLLLPFTTAWGLGVSFRLFNDIPHWDSVAHLCGGVSLGAIGAASVLALRPPRLRIALAVLAALALAALAGSVWEIGEWAADRMVTGASTLGDVNDTIGDLICDLAGATAGAALVLAARRAGNTARLARPFAPLRRLSGAGAPPPAPLRERAPAAPRGTAPRPRPRG